MLKRWFVFAANDNDQKRPKLSEDYITTLSEDTSKRDGKTLLLRMSTLDAVMTRMPLFYGQTNNIVVFRKTLNIFWYKCKI